MDAIFDYYYTEELGQEVIRTITHKDTRRERGTLKHRKDGHRHTEREGEK